MDIDSLEKQSSEYLRARIALSGLMFKPAISPERKQALSRAKVKFHRLLENNAGGAELREAQVHLADTQEAFDDAERRVEEWRKEFKADKEKFLKLAVKNRVGHMRYHAALVPNADLGAIDDTWVSVQLDEEQVKAKMERWESERFPKRADEARIEEMARSQRDAAYDNPRRYGTQHEVALEAIRYDPTADKARAKKILRLRAKHVALQVRKAGQERDTKTDLFATPSDYLDDEIVHCFSKLTELEAEHESCIRRTIEAVADYWEDKDRALYTD